MNGPGDQQDVFDPERLHDVLDGATEVPVAPPVVQLVRGAAVADQQAAGATPQRHIELGAAGRAADAHADVAPAGAVVEDDIAAVAGKGQHGHGWTGLDVLQVRRRR